MTHEEKQIHNAVHAELREFEEFKELVRQMREAQKALHDTTYKRLSETELCQLRAWAFEKAVDEYLKKMEV
jgi:sialic acid synthase SpsE